MNEFAQITDNINRRIEKSILRDDNILFDAMNYSLKAGGKRLRPLIAVLCCMALGGKEEDAMDYGIALEMIHTYSLIHDDLPAMDNDELRRGKPTCHIKFGEATAILAGDALLTSAFLKAAQAPLSDTQNLNAVKILSEAAGADGMVLGQSLDMDIGEKTMENILNMYAHKTGKLLLAAARLGCIAAGKCMNEFDDYAENLGVAFQIRDDILDIEGDESILGKPINSDVENDKNTIISVVGIDKAKQMVEEYTEKARIGAKGNAQLCALADMLVGRTK